MKKNTLFAVSAIAVLAIACKSKSNSGQTDSSSTTSTTQTEATTTQKPAEGNAANAPKTYQVTFLPDSAVLGKKQEALVKVIPVSAVQTSDPDGKDQGVELTFKISVTDKEKIGGNTVGITPSDFRLVLDNNTSITQTSGGYTSVEPEATKESENIVYRLPAGTKPKQLNLFYDQPAFRWALV